MFAYVIVLAIITYIDRVCISQAAPLIRRDLALSESELGWVFSAFFLSSLVGIVVGVVVMRSLRVVRLMTSAWCGVGFGTIPLEWVVLRAFQIRRRAESHG